MDLEDKIWNNWIVPDDEYREYIRKAVSDSVSDSVWHFVRETVSDSIANVINPFHHRRILLKTNSQYKYDND